LGLAYGRSALAYLDLLPHREGQARRTPGRLKGQIEMAEDFDQTPAEPRRRRKGWIL
jgi:hypothetical protein